MSARISSVCSETDSLSFDEDVLVIAEEFGGFRDARRRVDLLGVDRQGHLASLCSNAAHDDLRGRRPTYERHLHVHERDAADVARQRLLDWMTAVQAEGSLSTDTRIILISRDFGAEVVSTVLWLRDYGIDIRRIRLVPYRASGRHSA